MYIWTTETTGELDDNSAIMIRVSARTKQPNRHQLSFIFSTGCFATLSYN